MTNSILKLKETVTKLEKKITKLTDMVAYHKEKRFQAEKSLKYYKQNIEDMIEKAVTKAVKEVTDKYEAIIKEKDQIKIELVYYPPYHSKYNPVGKIMGKVGKNVKRHATVIRKYM